MYRKPIQVQQFCSDYIANAKSVYYYFETVDVYDYDSM